MSSPAFAASTAACATNRPTSCSTRSRRGSQLAAGDLRLPEPDRVDRSLGPAVTVIGAWLAQRASELDLDPALLATRAELAHLLQGDPSRLATGWRAELVGAPLQRLLAGDAVLVLRDGGRRLELQDR